MSLEHTDSATGQAKSSTTLPDFETFATGLRVRKRHVMSGIRRRSSQIWFEVSATDGRALTVWPTRKAAKRHASGVPVVQRQLCGAWWVWRGERAEVFVTKEAAQAARRRKEAVDV